MAKPRQSNDHSCRFAYHPRDLAVDQEEDENKERKGSFGIICNRLIVDFGDIIDWRGRSQE